MLIYISVTLDKTKVFRREISNVIVHFLCSLQEANNLEKEWNAEDENYSKCEIVHTT